MISAVIITLNEEEHLKGCISSLHGVVDEILVIDALSTDRTAAIAESLGARVISKRWEGYGVSRNHGASVAKNDWILSIDADERLSSELREAIKRVNLDKNNIYKFHRKNIYKNKPIKYGFLKPERKAKLYNRSSTKWSLKEVHETLALDQSMMYYDLFGDLIHLTNTCKEEHRVKLDRYAELISREWTKNAYIPHHVVRILGPLFHFFKTYILQLGFLEGRIGVETSISAYQYSRDKYKHFEMKRLSNYK